MLHEDPSPAAQRSAKVDHVQVVAVVVVVGHVYVVVVVVAVVVVVIVVVVIVEDVVGDVDSGDGKVDKREDGDTISFTVCFFFFRCFIEHNI